ncbi:cation:proton antiporter [Microbispora sp. NBC_01189]|uniref:cation:proton antiporter domain-containing protein n=1 Tax=Microbispora sp. NBC_01189 TaxID=2903583 RepID=UPI002E0E4C62|nr:cation:proton antiporter [Microbispora sp. NBC_01189]
MTGSSGAMLVVVDVAVVLAVGAALTPLIHRLRQPRVIAEIVAGIALGPSLLGLLPGHLTTRLFPAEVRPELSAISQVGVLLFMFLVGWEMNLGHARTRGGAVLSISLASIALPFGTGAVLAAWLHRDHAIVDGHHVDKVAFVLFVGTAMAVTAFPVLARIIMEHRLQMTPVGVISLAAAAVGDVLAWCMLALVSIVAASSHPERLLQVIGWSALYALVLWMAVRPLLGLLIRRLSRGGDVSPQLLVLVVAGVFLSAYTTDLIGIHAIFGAFSFGLIMPRGSGGILASRVRIPMEHVTGLLMPIFFISTGLSVDIIGLGGGGLLELAAIIGVACLSKLGGVVAAGRAAGMSWADARTVGLLMNTRGLTELIILNAGLSLGILDTRMFTMMVVMALATTAMAGPFIPRRPYARPEGALPPAAAVEAAPAAGAGRGPGGSGGSGGSGAA